MKMYMVWLVGTWICSYSCLNSVELYFTAIYVHFSGSNDTRKNNGKKTAEIE